MEQSMRLDQYWPASQQPDALTCTDLILDVDSAGIRGQWAIHHAKTLSSTIQGSRQISKQKAPRLTTIFAGPYTTITIPQNDITLMRDNKITGLYVFNRTI
jgi:hypothetical protein